MKRAWINPERIADALRTLRSNAGLTQRQVAQRARKFDHLGMGRLLESQVSDFERGRALPSMGSFLNFLAACSPEGDEVDWRAFERSVASEGVRDPPADLAGRMAADAVDRLVGLICETIVDGRDLELDEDQKRDRVSRRSVHMAEVLREELARRGLSLRDLDARRGWAEGSAERLFAEPAKFPHEEALRLGLELRIPIGSLFELPERAEAKDRGL